MQDRQEGTERPAAWKLTGLIALSVVFLVIYSTSPGYQTVPNLLGLCGFWALSGVVFSQYSPWAAEVVESAF